MKNKITYISAVTALLLSTSTQAFWGSDINLEKERQPIAPEWVKKNDNKVTRNIFAIDKLALPAVNNHIEEVNRLFSLKRLDFDTISTLDPMQLKLKYQSSEATKVRVQYAQLINSVQLIIDEKVAIRKRALLASEIVSQDYAMQIEVLKANQAGYKTMVQAVYNLKDQTIEADRLSKESVKEYSAQLVTALNKHPSLSRPLKSSYFERPKIKIGNCSESVKSKSSSIEVAYSVQGFCFSRKFSIVKNTADSLTSDKQVMSQLKSKIITIAQEKIKQGDTYKKEGGQEGYSQQIKAFSHGGIQSVKIAAKKQYGSTEKGLGFKIKSLNKQLASNNRKVASQKLNVAKIPLKELLHSPQLKALKPLSDKLDVLISHYLDASIANIIGEPIKQSMEDYQSIELDESESLLLVKDTYPSNTGEQAELYLVNTNILQESAAIKKHFNGKPIPVRVAVGANGLLQWQGKYANYPHIVSSIAHFLSDM